MAKHLKVHISLALCVAIVFSMFSMCFTASAASTYNWDFTGADGETQAADMLSKATHVTTSSTYTAAYDSTSAAFELKVPAQAKFNGVVLNTPEGGAPTSFNVITGTDDTTGTHNLHSALIIYGEDDLYFHGAQFVYYKGFTINLYDFEKKSLTSSSDGYAQWSLTHKTTVKLQSTTVDKMTMNGEALSSLPTSVLGNATVLKTMKFEHNVQVADGVTTIFATARVTVDGNEYEFVCTPTTITETGAATYSGTKTATIPMGTNYKNVFGVASCWTGGSTVQIYSMSADYGLGEGGGETECTHSYDAVVTDPTCEEAGYTTYTCSLCGDTYTGDSVAATGHTEAEAVVENEVAADCDTEGSYDTVVYCSVCGDEISRETTTVSALGHDYDAVVTPPAVGVQGYTTYTCTVCGASYVDDYVDAIPKSITKTATVVLDGKVNVIVTATPNFETDAAVITVNGDTYDMVKGASGEFTYTIERYAHQMTEAFEISIEADGVVEAGTITIAGVLNSVYNTAADAETKALAIATANYGAAAQVYFGDTGVLANDWVPAEEKTNDYTYNDVETVDMNTAIADAYDEMSLSAAVQLGNEIKMVVIFGHEDFADKNLKVTCEGQELTVVENVDGRFYVITDGIAPADMDAGYDFVITADDEEVATFTYSVNNYIKALGGATTNANLIALLNAMVAYGAAANNY